MRNHIVKHLMTGAGILTLLGLATGCSDTTTAPVEHSVALVEISPTVDTVLVGSTIQLSITLTCHHGDTLDRAVAWTTSNPAIALVSSTGLVTGVSRGTAVITAASEGKVGNAGVLIIAPVDGVSIEPAVVILDIGETAQLAAALRDPEGNVLNRPIVWGSVDRTIVDVDENGLITAVAAGTTSITAISEGKTGTAAVTVRVPVATVDVTPGTAALSVGFTLQLTAIPKDAAGTPLDRLVTWTTSDATLATVDAAGLVSALATGSVTITATSQGKAGTAILTLRVPVATVTVSDPGTEPVAPGGTLQLTATARDLAGTILADRTFNWSSSDNGVATVSNDGLVTGVARGTATITAMVEGKSGSASVRVAGEVSTVGNNLSYPVVFTEGIGLTGLAVTTDPGVRPTAEENILVDALPFWYAGNVADYGAYYLQQGVNTWQAEWLDGSAGGIQQAEVAWGDNLTGVQFNTHQNIRIEVVLNDLGGRQLSGFNMTALYGTGETEMQGTDGTTAPFTPTLYSVMPRLILEKLDDATRQPVYTAFDGAIYEAFGGDGPGSFTAEVNVAGKLIYGYNLMIQNLTLPGDLHKYGWWRATFVLDDNGQVGGTPVARNTALASLIAGTGGKTYPPQLDQAANRTWVDFDVKSASGGGH